MMINPCDMIIIKLRSDKKIDSLVPTFKHWN